MHTYSIYMYIQSKVWWKRGEAYIAPDFQVGTSVKEHLRHFQVTMTSGEVQRSETILSETDTQCKKEPLTTGRPATTTACLLQAVK